MFQGDANPRSNLPGRPGARSVSLLGFVLGLGTSWRRSPAGSTKSYWLCGSAIVAHLVGVLGAAERSYGLCSALWAREIGITPAVALVVAVGFRAIGRLGSRPAEKRNCCAGDRRGAWVWV